jgi:hypothetical protein
MTHNFERLKAHILPLSSSSDFQIAQTEWDLVAVEISEELDECPCGKEIKEHCYIHNRLTSRETYVGNVCINRFMGLDTGTLFAGLKRIKAEVDAAPNDALIKHANSHGYLWNDNEYKFLKQTARKRRLSEAQLSWRQKINRRIISQTVVRKRGDVKPKPSS